MRVYLVWLVVTFLSFYAVKDWHRALCFLIILMAFIERPDMPRSVFGIPGLNPWNILFFGVLVGWLAREKVKDIAFPGNTGKLLLLYALVVFIASVRQILDDAAVIEYIQLRGHSSYSAVGVFNDAFINTYKYAVVGILFFYGSDTEERVKLGLLSVFAFNILIALQVIKWMPIQDIANGDVLEARARRVLDREIGYYRTDIAAMLAGSSWAIYAYRQVVLDKIKPLLVYLFSMICALGMALTGGRTGVLSWVVTALLMSVIKWKHIIVIMAVAAFVGILVLPSVSERLSQGFASDEEESLDSRSEELADRYQAVEGQTDLFTVTAGRIVIWPMVLEKIGEAPFFGYGRQAMVRTGLATFVLETYGEVFPHTHNAYLEMLFDNGILMSFPVFAFFFTVVVYSIRLLRRSDAPLVSASGGAALAVVMSQLVASFGAQSFYPTAGTVSMWAIIGIMLRVYAKPQCISETENLSRDPHENNTRPNFYS